MGDIVLWVESAGLGDHLIYSTIPELFARRGRRVYVSNTTSTRNDEVRSLLYDENPFIAGWSDAAPNAGTGHTISGVTEVIRLASIIQWVELAHGLPATNLYPRIYYRPRFRPEFADVVLVEPHSITQRFAKDRFEGFVERLKFPSEQMRVVTSAYRGRHGGGSLGSLPRVHAESLHEYIDMIYSCLAYIGTESGGSALASAVRQDEGTPEVYALTTTFNWNHRVYIFPNVIYTVVNGLQRDW